MTATVFVDTNIIVYAESADEDKTRRATEIIEENPTLSTQVINETISVLTRKHGFKLIEAYEIAESLLDLCTVVPVDVQTIKKAIELSKSYSFSHWDSLIVAAALNADCKILYSEDLQHGQLIEDRLQIVNPFRANPL